MPNLGTGGVGRYDDPSTAFLEDAMSAANLTRRDFIKSSAVAAGAMGLPLGLLQAKGASRLAKAERCILIMLTGGPSQLETWDPKPDAPSHIRGPFGTIATK